MSISVAGQRCVWFWSTTWLLTRIWVSKHCFSRIVPFHGFSCLAYRALRLWKCRWSFGWLFRFGRTRKLWRNSKMQCSPLPVILHCCLLAYMPSCTKFCTIVYSCRITYRCLANASVGRRRFAGFVCWIWISPWSFCTFSLAIALCCSAWCSCARQFWLDIPVLGKTLQVQTCTTNIHTVPKKRVVVVFHFSLY